MIFHFNTVMMPLNAEVTAVNKARFERRATAVPNSIDQIKIRL